MALFPFVFIFIFSSHMQRLFTPLLPFFQLMLLFRHEFGYFDHFFAMGELESNSKRRTEDVREEKKLLWL